VTFTDATYKTAAEIALLPSEARSLAAALIRAADVMELSWVRRRWCWRSHCCAWLRCTAARRRAASDNGRRSSVRCSAHRSLAS